MPESATPALRFAAVGPAPLEADFLGGRLISDGGPAWLAAADASLGLAAALAAGIPDWRRRRGRHDLATPVAQRVFRLAAGSEDQDAADPLRTDPLLKHVCGRLPKTGADLAGQPTRSRLENAADARSCFRLAATLSEVYLRERERAGVPVRVVLHVDATDAPTHGDQEGTAYRAYVRQHQYVQLPVFDGDTDQLVTAVLRWGTAHAGHGVVPVLRRVVRALWARWPGVAVEPRADGGFAAPALDDWCEAEGVGYTIGLVPNARFAAAAAPLAAEAARQAEAGGGAGVRLHGEVAHRAATWPRARRVVVKAEELAEGPNTRYVLTSRPDPPAAAYAWYAARGASESWIKDLETGCFGGRLSRRRFWANQLRLLLRAAAYCLLDTLRHWLGAAGVARMTLETRRVRLIKIGGRVRQRPDRVHLRLATSHPNEAWRRALAACPGPFLNSPG